MSYDPTQPYQQYQSPIVDALLQRAQQQRHASSPMGGLMNMGTALGNAFLAKQEMGKLQQPGVVPVTRQVSSVPLGMPPMPPQGIY